jgi:thioredoxin reductase
MTAGAAPRRVTIVGGGPAGLSAAIELRRRGTPEVVVFEREQVAGGAPRHTDHLGFGLRDLHRVLSGPSYARRLVDTARAVGVDLRTGSPVFERPDADAVILATGIRERPRAARLIPGDRPAGVYTTGAVQQLVAIHHRRVGTRAVIVGAEHVSFSAIWTLRHGGCISVAMVTEQPRHQSVWPLRLASAVRHRVPIITDVQVTAIVGRERVEAVELSDGRSIVCDTVVFTGDWVPEVELARHVGVPLDDRRRPVTGGGDGLDGYRTPVDGIFVCGNIVRPSVAAADACALDGRRLATLLTGSRRR